MSVLYHYIRHYRLHLLRRKLQLRALRKAGELKSALDRTERIKRGEVLLFTTVRNERVRLPYFLQHYRSIGVKHFFVVDNGSDDESFEFLSTQPDVSVWTTVASYGGARAGMDWINALARRYAPGHWIIFADADEFLVYPFCDSRPLRALTDWLDEAGIRAMSAMLLDMYPKGKIAAQTYESGQNPFEIAAWFDGGNYTIHKNEKFGNLWIQGGPRQRVFFTDDPENAPALNKIPLVKWQKDYVFVSSSHMLLPSRLNKTYDARGGEQICGVMLHAKFVDPVIGKAQEELERGEHYGDGREYVRYAAALAEEPDLWTQRSEKYLNWRQLEGLGLISRGNWA